MSRGESRIWKKGVDLCFGKGVDLGFRIWERGVDLGFVTGEGGTANATAATIKVNNIHNSVLGCNYFN